MLEHTSDDEIRASVQRATDMLLKLKLSREERQWAFERARGVFHDVTENLMNSGKAFDDLRAVTATATLAFAMILTQDWADKVDTGNK